MHVREAVELAKREVVALFGLEMPQNIGLEEVDYDERRKIWHITIGFSRPWELQITALQRRSYKVVSIAEKDGRVLSVKNHQTANA